MMTWRSFNTITIITPTILKKTNDAKIQMKSVEIL